MTFSYNLVLALFLLAPGFAAYTGLFFTSQKDGRLHPAPPAPGSIVTLALVTLATLLLHAAWALALCLQAAWVKAGWWHLTVDYDPNIYVDLLAAGKPGFTLNGWGIFSFLASLVVLCVGGFLVTLALMSNAAVEKRLSGLLYGWAADLVGQMREKDPKYVRVATAFVLTTIEHEGAMFGYEGMLQNMALNPDKEIISISLKDVTAFYVDMKPGEFKRTVLTKTEGIPNIYLEKSQIQNVAFSVYRTFKPDLNVVVPAADVT